MPGSNRSFGKAERLDFIAIDVRGDGSVSLVPNAIDAQVVGQDGLEITAMESRNIRHALLHRGVWIPS